MDKTVPSGRVKGTLTPPCSKSYAQRALAASLLCEETSVLRNIEFCSDTRSALQCIETLGARVTRIGEETLSIEGGLRPQGTRSASASRVFRHAYSPPSLRSAARRSPSKARARCSAARWR